MAPRHAFSSTSTSFTRVARSATDPLSSFSLGSKLHNDQRCVHGTVHSWLKHCLDICWVLNILRVYGVFGLFMDAMLIFKVSSTRTYSAIRPSWLMWFYSKYPARELATYFNLSLTSESSAWHCNRVFWMWMPPQRSLDVSCLKTVNRTFSCFPSSTDINESADRIWISWYVLLQCLTESMSKSESSSLRHAHASVWSLLCAVTIGLSVCIV